MPYYETVFMARQDLSEKQVAELTEKYSQVVKDNGGKILKTENWGLRSLAYRVNKSRKAHYVLLESDAPGPAVIEMERLMRLDEDVMRSLSLRLEEPTDGPSIMMGRPKSDDDSRTEKTTDKKEAA